MTTRWAKSIVAFWYINFLNICRDPPPYPELKSLRYPKVGTENPKVSLHVVNLSDVSSKKTLTPPESIRAQG